MYLEFWRIFVKEYGHLRILLVIVGVTIAFSLLEGVNIGLLVPLLESLGSAEQGEGKHWVSEAFSVLFEGLGIPFQLNAILLVLSALILGLAVLKYLQMILVGRARENFVAWLRSSTMENLMHADVSYYHRHKLGALTDTLTTQANRAGDCLYHITELIASLGVIAAYLTAAFLIAPVLTLFAFGMLLVVSLVSQYNVIKARNIGNQLVQRNNDLQVSSLESLNGIRVIKAFLLERLRVLDFSQKAAAVSEASYRLERNRSQTVVIQETSLFALVGGIVFVGVAVLNLEVAVIVTLLFILYRLTPRVTNINSRRQALAATIAFLESIRNTREQAARTEVVSGDQPFTAIQTGISLRSVSFSYDDSAPVLQSTSLTIEPRKMTAIVGASGAGKSTLVDLILRYYDPQQGRVEVDGVDLKELDLVSWRRSIGLVSQDIFLFNDTIASNIALDTPRVTPDKIVEAARLAYAHEFIQQLPMKYDTVVGDRGWNLSGGQRQRIALARAILKDPEVLILDEATSSLDSESERLIQNYIHAARGSRTIIVVAHRMSTIQDADKIAVLQDGKIVEEGDWNSLRAGSGVFASYHNLQFGG